MSQGGKVLSAKEQQQKERDIEKQRVTSGLTLQLVGCYNEQYSEMIFYSERYSDDEYEYRHVILPKGLVKYLPSDRLAEEDEWRGLGIRQSPGWEHYLRHEPEPHVMLFKREKDYQIKY